MMTRRPLVAVTPGDPAGIGPEIAIKALSHAEGYGDCVAFCLADPGVMDRAITSVGSDVSLRIIDTPVEATGELGTIEVVPVKAADLDELPLGRVTAAAGDAAYQAVRAAIDLAMRGQVDAIATGPLHKEALHRAGHNFPGHTEIFSHFTGSSKYAMMLIEGGFRVAHVSTHVSLRRACDAVTRQRVLDVIELTHAACLRFGISAPRIGVAGLNPHAGDGGLFGDEEREHIAPAVSDAVTRGWDVRGPFPADTFFAWASGGEFDACIAMYHDQGHIPVKMKGFRYDAETRDWGAVNGVNITLGLPIVRASVDHGTAFDLAGTGRASERSMLDAIRYAAQLANTPTPVCQP